MNTIAHNKRIIHMPETRQGDKTIPAHDINLGNMDIRDWINPKLRLPQETYMRIYNKYLEYRYRGYNIRKSMIYAIWNYVNVEIKYRYDNPYFNSLDFWQLPHETLQLKQGDCEDTTFLLQSLLESYGVNDTYAVIGFYKGITTSSTKKEMYGHGFVIGKMYNNRYWIFESTLENEFPIWMGRILNGFSYIPAILITSKHVIPVTEQVWQQLGMGSDYSDYEEWIKAMWDYVFNHNTESKAVKVKWMHKTKRKPLLPLENIIENYHIEDEEKLEQLYINNYENQVELY